MSLTKVTKLASHHHHTRNQPPHREAICCGLRAATACTCDWLVAATAMRAVMAACRELAMKVIEAVPARGRYWRMQVVGRKRTGSHEGKNA
jgi:hypothetical protein